jgi:hypothetical protein
MKRIVTLFFLLGNLVVSAQTCPNYFHRNNGNGQPSRCGSPDCSVSAKTGDIDLDFGTCPSPLPTLVLLSPTLSGFCFDPGNIEVTTPCQVHYCFRGQNLPSSGNMSVQFNQSGTTYSCIYPINGGSGTLPITLINFAATTNNRTTIFNWEAANTSKLNSFAIEASKDGSNFYNEALVTASAGNERSKYTYSITAKENTTFYRLKTLEKDGGFAYSEIIKVKGVNQKEILINANSSNTALLVTTGGTNLTNARYQFINTAGQVEQQGAINNNSIAITQLKTGVHYISITSNTGQLLYQSNFIKH